MLRGLSLHRRLEYTCSHNHLMSISIVDLREARTFKSPKYILSGDTCDTRKPCERQYISVRFPSRYPLYALVITVC